MSHMQYNISHMGTNKLNSQYLGKAMKSAIKQAGFTQDETMYIDGLSRLNVHDPNAKLTANELDRLADLLHEQAVHARQLATGNREQ